MIVAIMIAIKPIANIPKPNSGVKILSLPQQSQPQTEQFLVCYTKTKL